MVVLLPDGRLGTLTHAINCPLVLSYLSISWLSFVSPSEDVNRMSLPLDWAPAFKFASVMEMRTGKSVTPPDATFVPSIVISLRLVQVGLDQPAPVGSQVSQLWTACPVPTGAQFGVPVVPLREKIQVALEPVLIEPSQPTMPGFIIAPPAILKLHAGRGPSCGVALTPFAG